MSRRHAAMPANTVGRPTELQVVRGIWADAGCRTYVQRHAREQDEESDRVPSIRTHSARPCPNWSPPRSIVHPTRRRRVRPRRIGSPCSVWTPSRWLSALIRARPSASPLCKTGLNGQRGGPPCSARRTSSVRAQGSRRRRARRSAGSTAGSRRTGWRPCRSLRVWMPSGITSGGSAAMNRESGSSRQAVSSAAPSCRVVAARFSLGRNCREGASRNRRPDR